MEKFEKVWRDFENNPISHSVAHYLFAVFSLQENGSHFPRAADVAKKLGVSRNAVSLQIKSLQESNFIKVDPHNRLHLTEQGNAAVNFIASQRRSFRTFLVEVLGVPADIAEKDSCKVEHLLSAQTGAAFVRFINFLRSRNDKGKPLIDQFRSSVMCCDDDHSCGFCSNICLVKESESDT